MKTNNNNNNTRLWLLSSCRSNHNKRNLQREKHTHTTNNSQLNNNCNCVVIVHTAAHVLFKICFSFILGQIQWMRSFLVSCALCKTKIIKHEHWAHEITKLTSSHQFEHDQHCSTNASHNHFNFVFIFSSFICPSELLCTFFFSTLQNNVQYSIALMIDFILNDKTDVRF